MMSQFQSEGEDVQPLGNMCSRSMLLIFHLSINTIGLSFDVVHINNPKEPHRYVGEHIYMLQPPIHSVSIGLS